MLTLRQSQLDAFHAAAGGRFEDLLVEHLKGFTPHQAEALGDDGLMRVVRYGMERADNHGFTLRGPVRFYVEAMFLLGSDFDSDPQYPWAYAILSGAEPIDEVERADALHAAVTDYLQASATPEMLQRAMHAARALLDAEPPAWSERLGDLMLAAAKRSWPEKYDYIGPEPLRILYEDCTERAAYFEIDDGEGISLLFSLAYAIGHGFAFDPQFPWIASALELPDPPQRCPRLRARAKTYLDAALRHLGA